MTEDLDILGCDVSLQKLQPLQPRDIDLNKNAGFRKIVASIEAIGLIEPLAVCRKKEDTETYLILDGYLRYKACQQLGIECVPCIVHKDLQAYTFNKYVNRLSPYQESRMMRKSLETLDASTISQTFGIKSIKYRLAPTLTRNLHPDVVKAFERDELGRSCAYELARVLPERQLEILKEMKATSNYSTALCQSLTIKTPMTKRNASMPQRRAWVVDEGRKKELVSQLQDAEKQNDFYANLYQQYSADLLRISFYVRKLTANPRVLAHLKAHHQDLLTGFTEIINSSPLE